MLSHTLDILTLTILSFPNVALSVDTVSNDWWITTQHSLGTSISAQTLIHSVDLDLWLLNLIWATHISEKLVSQMLGVSALQLVAGSNAHNDDNLWLIVKSKKLYCKIWRPQDWIITAATNVHAILRLHNNIFKIVVSSSKVTGKLWSDDAWLWNWQLRYNNTRKRCSYHRRC